MLAVFPGSVLLVRQMPNKTGFTGLLHIVMGNHPKPHIVVEVIGYVPVTVSTAGVPSIVVPRAAAQTHPALQKRLY